MRERGQSSAQYDFQGHAIDLGKTGATRRAA
jgi:hypothetical protein